MRGVYFAVPPERWPPTIAGLKPNTVGVTWEGVYIEMSSFYVEERGYFIPRDEHGFKPHNSSKLSLEALGQGVYWYKESG